MLVFLLRHGQADQNSIDHERLLTEFGQQQIRSTAGKLRLKKIEIAAVLHSGLKRAFETADIIMQELHLHCDFSETRGLQPNDEVSNWGEQMKLLDKNTLFVGHNPFMSDLVSYLCDESITFATGQLVCIEIIENEANVLWTLTP